MQFPATSIEYRRWNVVGTADPTGGSVSVALTATDEAPVSWVPGAWEGTAVELPNETFRATAVFLFGSGALAKPPGVYAVWVRVTAAPEDFIRRVGHLTLT